MTLLQRLKASLPTLESLQAQPRLRPIATRLAAPVLWRPQPEAMARGVAIGLFWAFAVPVAQILVAAAHCVWWRANIPAAAAMTLITNPLTIGAWLWLAYRTGSTLLGAPSDAAGWLMTVGMPTVLGMGLFAVGTAGAGYVLVRLAYALRGTFIGGGQGTDTATVPMPVTGARPRKPADAGPTTRPAALDPGAQ